MKRTAVLSFLLAFFCRALSAESPAKEPAVPGPGWKKPVIAASVNFARAGFDNWAAGGENTLAWLASLNAGADYDSDSSGWENSLKVKFGQLTSDAGGTIKSDDEIRLDSLYKLKLGFKLDPFAAIMWLTQMAPGYAYSPEKTEISAFNDPGYLKESAGFVYSPADVFSIRLGAAASHIITKNYSLPYAGEDTAFRTEIGAELVASLNAAVAENVLLSSKAEFFSNLRASDQVTALWDSLFTAKINSFLNVNFNFVMKYNRLESFKRQLKDSLSIGLTYSFI